MRGGFGMERSAMTIRAGNWLQALQQASASGLSNKEWCRQNGVPASTFYRWKRVLRDQLLDQMKSSESCGIHFVKLPQEEKSGSSGQICIRSENLVLEVSADLSEEALCRILRAVKHAG